MTPVTTLASLILVAQIMSINAAFTKPDTTFGEQCPAGYGISRIISFYSHGHKDRTWHFTCKRYVKRDYVTSVCHWSGWLNWYHHNLFYRCPSHGVLSGVFSTHNNYYEDRRFRFKCCRPRRLFRYCRWTHWVNAFKGRKFYVVPYGFFINGAYSHHSKVHQDRVWRFVICRF